MNMHTMNKPNIAPVSSNRDERFPSVESNYLSRRGFLSSATRLLGAGSILSLDVSRFAHAAGSDTLRVGLIGCGGRGIGAAHNILNTGPGVKLVAMGDVFEDCLKKALAQFKGKSSGQFDVPLDRQFIGFNAYRMVMESEIDAVILATPPGFRPIHFEAAVNAGKHCFLEPPVAVDAPGIRRLLQANEIAKRKALSVIVDYQRRFDPGYEAVVSKVHAGAIGNVSKLEAYWRQSQQTWVLNRADLESKLRRRLPEMEFQLRNWLHFAWLAGDIALDSISHNLDICNWIMRSPPDRARATSARKQWTTNAYGDMPDFFSAEYTYPNGAVMTAETYRLKDHPAGVAEIAHGATGIAQCREFLITDRSGKPVWRYERDRVVDNLQRGQDLFVESIRGGKKLNMVQDAASVALTGIMGRMSSALGRVVTRQETLAAKDALFPDGQLTFDTPPPTLPDKFGDYQFPARGRGA